MGLRIEMDSLRFWPQSDIDVSFFTGAPYAFMAKAQ